MRFLTTFFVLCVLLFSTASTAMAGKAGIVLLPTRIVLGEKDRNVTVTVKNNGDAVGAYRIEVVDMEMPEKGSISKIPEGEDAPYSAKDMIRISPRQIMLKPEESQSVRILVRRPRDLADGEYRSHLKVKLVDDNVMSAEEKEAAENNVAISIKPRFSLIIPMIIREGATSAQLSLANPALKRGDKPSLDLTIQREGNQSVIGDIDVIHIALDGKQVKLQHHAGLAVYRPTPRRQVTVPLEVPEGVSLQSGKLQILYRTQDKENSKVMAETFLPL